MKIPMAEIMRGNCWKKGWWRPGTEDGTCLRKEGTRTPLSECQFQTENSLVRGNTLHPTDDHGLWGIQGEIAQAGTGRGPSM
jgi:hypothetical protein